MPKKPGHEMVQTRERSWTPSSPAMRQALGRATPELAADEEKALRMHNGVSVQRTIVLERVGQDHPDSREKLLGLELELLRQWRERRDQGQVDPRSKVAPAAPVAETKAAPNAKRDRIVQALKKKPSR